MKTDAVVVTLLAALLTACGGGGDGGGGAPGAGGSGAPVCTTNCNPPPTDGTQAPPSGDTLPPPSDVVQPPPSSGTQPPPSSGTQPPPPVPTEPTDDFFVTAVIAPPDGATLTEHKVFLEVNGSGFRNAELLPPTGYDPKYAILPVSPDGTRAAGEFDIRLLADVTQYTFRISVFDKPRGHAGARDLVAMQPRTWRINHGLNHYHGDRFAVTFPAIYPTSRDDLFLRQWLEASDEFHEDQFADPRVWARFIHKLASYIPHHIDFVGGAQPELQSERRNCVDKTTVEEKNIPACRRYITELLNLVEAD